MAKKTTSPPAAEYASAMDKIRDEMAKSSNARYVQVVGEFLTGYLQTHPEAEGAILTRGKSIAGSLFAMREEAEKVKEGNVAVLDDQTAFGIVLGYFGIKGGPDVIKTAIDVTKEAANVPTSAANVPSPAANVPSPAANVPTPEPEPVDPFDLDALLGVV